MPVRIFTPDAGSAPRPAVLYIHGGGMIVGSPQLEAFGTARVARNLGVVAISPDYRLAPEHPFPAALDDCMTVLRWMLGHAEELGIDPGRIAVMGGSAGGGLSAAVAQRSHDEGIALRAQVLMYPMIDDRTALRTDHDGRGTFVWTASSNRFGWTSYLGREPRMSDAPEYAAPARRVDLSGLPPAWVGVGELDLFYEEDVAYAEKLRPAGSSVNWSPSRECITAQTGCGRKQLRCKTFTTVPRSFCGPVCDGHRSMMRVALARAVHRPSS